MRQTTALFQLVTLYARAYSIVYRAHLTDIVAQRCEYAGDQLKKNYKLHALLQLFFHNHESVKQNVAHELIKKYELPESIYSLCMILIKKNRMHFLPAILKKLGSLYRNEHNITQITIQTSHAIEQTELAPLIGMLSTQTGKTILYNYSIDATLIAGIRAQSSTFLWESSIRKKLNALKAHFKQ